MAPASRGIAWLTLTGAVVTLPAQADPLRASSVNWIVAPGAESCGLADQLTRAIDERLQRHAFVSPEQASVSIEARVEHSTDSGHWHAVVHVRDLSGAVAGTRELDSAAPDCTELRDSVALAIALMIDPDALLHHLVAPELPTPPPPEKVPEPPPVTPTLAPPRRPPWRVSPTASLALGFGLLPSPAVGLLADVAVHPPKFWGVDVLGGFWGSQTTALAASGATTDFSLAFGGLAICPLSATPARAGFEVCGGAIVGALESVGHRFSISQSKTGVSAYAIGSGALRVPLAGPLALQLRADIGLAVYRDKFRYTDANGPHTVFEPAVPSATLAAGLSANLP